MKKLLLYYSFSGSIESLVPRIKELIDVDVIKLELEEPYSEDMKVFVERVRKELKENLLPKYKEVSYTIEEYDTVLIAVPNWGNTVPPVVKTFLLDHPLQHQKIYPIISHGGNGKVDIVNRIKELTTSKHIMQDLEIFTNEITSDELKAYLSQIK